MKIGDFITVVYYNPPSSKYPMFDISYGKIVGFTHGEIEFEVLAKIRTDIRRMIVKDIGFQLAIPEYIYAINSSFGLSCIDDCRKFGESYHRPSKSA